MPGGLQTHSAVNSLIPEGNGRQATGVPQLNTLYAGCASLNGRKDDFEGAPFVTPGGTIGIAGGSPASATVTGYKRASTGPTELRER